MASYKDIPGVGDAEPATQDGVPGFLVTDLHGETTWKSETVFHGMIHRKINLADYEVSA